MVIEFDIITSYRMQVNSKIRLTDNTILDYRNAYLQNVNPKFWLMDPNKNTA
jgi:hypothetical protein